MADTMVVYYLAQFWTVVPFALVSFPDDRFTIRHDYKEGKRIERGKREREKERRRRYNLDENHKIGVCVIMIECGFNCIIRPTLFSP